MTHRPDDQPSQFEDRTYKVIFFDLDGTLLPNDVEGFMHTYTHLIGKFAASIGLDLLRFKTAFGAGIKAMTANDGSRTNERAFWDTYYKEYGSTEKEDSLKQHIEEFYTGPFNTIGESIDPYPEAAGVIEDLKRKGYRLFLTTMPLFPESAVRARVKWAGLDPNDFEVITTYANSSSIKPQLRYYQQNIERAGVDPHDILMVGNNTLEDMSSLELGVDGYLITDMLLHPNAFDISSVKHGTFADFAQFASELPPVKSSEQPQELPSMEK